jgi:hypothetical protein
MVLFANPNRSRYKKEIAAYISPTLRREVFEDRAELLSCGGVIIEQRRR